MALGVKVAGTIYRLLNGTREIDTALLNCKKELAIQWMYEVSVADQLVVVIKLLKGNGAKRLASLTL
ncbi:MAG: hypothetical protein ABI315_03275 [Bacteroidia bacterium]